MNDFLASTWAFPLGKASEDVVNAYVLVLLFKISAFVFAAFQIFLRLQKRAENEASRPRSGALAAPAEIAALVAKLAHESLEIGSHQLDESMDKLRIPRGDFLRFLDDLEVDHGLSVPASARAMSTSISGIVAALCQGRRGGAASSAFLCSNASGAHEIAQEPTFLCLPPGFRGSWAG